MQETDEGKALVKKFSDRSRKVLKTGNNYFVPHKFTPDGDVLSEDNFNAKRDISRLTLDDFRLLGALQESGWNFETACEKAGLDKEKAVRRYKKLSYFEFEDKKAKALAALATPEFVTSQNVEGFYRDHLSDGQREHLKELAKISGAYKTSAINIQHNVFNLPALSPEAEAKFKALAEEVLEADIVKTEAA